MKNNKSLAVAKPQTQLLPISQTGVTLQTIEKKATLSTVKFLKEKKIRISEIEKNEEFTNSFAIVITKIAMLSGFKGEISQIDKDDIYKIILSRFKELSFEEIYKAFELERSCEYEEEISHFGVFNAKYICKILKEYKKWKAKKVFHHKKDLQKKMEKKEITEEMNMEALKNGVKRLTKYFGEHKIIPKGNNHIYNYLRKKGEIKQAGGIERDIIINQAKQNLVNDKKAQTGSIKVFVGDNELVSECKRIQLQNYFNKICYDNE